MNLKAQLEQSGLVSLPEYWSVLEMRELISEDRGISVGVMYPGNHHEQGIPLIKASDLNENRINPSPDFRISREKHHEYRRTQLEGGEILLSLVGDVGRCAVVPRSMVGWNAARAVAVIRLKNPEDALFLRSVLLSPFIQHLMHTWSTTTVQATLNLKEIKQLPIPLPPKREREQIGQILSTFDDKIEINRRMNATLEATARALFQSWFVDFDPVRAKAEGLMPEGMDAETAALFPDTFEESELGMIPSGWRVGPLTQNIDVNPSRPLRAGVSAPYLAMENMPTSSALANEWIDREFGSGMRFINGDTLVARITPCLENGKTAYVDFLDNGQVGWGSTEYIVLRSKTHLPLEYTYLLARLDTFRAFAIQNMTGTSGRQRVSGSSFEHFMMVVPPPELAFKFGEIAYGVFRAMRANVNQSQTLSEMRNSLLPKLIAGQVRVGEVKDSLI